MIDASVFRTEPWLVREASLDLDVLAQSESVFALGNGHLGLRGNLDEGEPYGLPGTYLNGVYELRPLPYAEAGYGYPESGQTMINVTNGKVLRLLVDDEPFDVRYGTLHHHERVLDFRAGTLRRTVEWASPAGQVMRVTSVRLVSFTQRAVAAIEYEVEAVGDPARIVVQSELVANEPMPLPDNDPRVAAALMAPLVGEDHGTQRDSGVTLVHRTEHSGLRVAAAMDHIVDGPERTDMFSESGPDIGRVTITSVLQPGQKLRVLKLLAYGWSHIRSRQALWDQVAAALTAAVHTGWDGLQAEQRQYLDTCWSRTDVELEGDPQMEHAARFGLFHVLQASARAERRAIPAKGLTGTGYDGHAFWDTETFVLPVLTSSRPEAARNALLWRHSILPAARERAAALGHTGAAFPWRTIAGEECSGYWPAGTAAFHVNADIADAVLRYIDATEDTGFETKEGLELLVETARLWRSLGHHDEHGHFRLPGMTGPDEYSALGDNNVYTNLMAQQNLRAAAELARRHAAEAGRLGVDEDERMAWQVAADAMYIPYDAELGVHPQAELFTTYRVWDFENTPPDRYPLFLHFPYFDLYRTQVVKQADLVLAMQLRNDAFTDEEKARNFAYYEALTVRDSSLSAITQAVLAAEVGHLDLAYDYLSEVAQMDLGDLHHNTRNGLHMASLAGVWTVIVAGFGGLRAHGGRLSFAPKVPDGISRLSFNLWYRQRNLCVTASAGQAIYDLRDGDPITIAHYGEPVEVTPNDPVKLPIPPLPTRPPPSQPPGRAPARRIPPGGEEARDS
ncbi:MAG TPA: glycosyl hydrolase family 65 protein [Acidimicrobiia bacterium]